MEGTPARTVSIDHKRLLLEGDFDGSEQLLYRPGHGILIVDRDEIDSLENAVSESEGALDYVRDDLERTEASLEKAERQLAEALEEIEKLRAGAK